jgi:hypothetical protein
MTIAEFSPEYIDYLRERFNKPELNVKYDPINRAELNVDTTPPKVETILGNDLTNSQKWAWVIGLTFAIWGVIYWSEKKLK